MEHGVEYSHKDSWISRTCGRWKAHIQRTDCVPAPSANFESVSKLRDGWGRDVEGGIGKYAKDEGGIVICMPSSKRRSLIYVIPRTRSKGRTVEERRVSKKTPNGIRTTIVASSRF